MARPKFAPKSTPSHGLILKPRYLPHPWTRPIYDAKRHPDLIRRFSTQHWTDRPTDARTHVHMYIWTDRLSTGKFDDYRLLITQFNSTGQKSRQLAVSRQVLNFTTDRKLSNLCPVELSSVEFLVITSPEPSQLTSTGQLSDQRPIHSGHSTGQLL